MGGVFIAFECGWLHADRVACLERVSTGTDKRIATVDFCWEIHLTEITCSVFRYISCCRPWRGDIPTWWSSLLCAL